MIFNAYALTIDNLQFMLSQQAEGIQKFDLQDRVINQLRTLATEKNVHIINDHSPQESRRWQKPDRI